VRTAADSRDGAAIVVNPSMQDLLAQDPPI
jgi:hypothetical protein